MDQVFFFLIIILRNPKLSPIPSPKSQTPLHNNNILVKRMIHLTVSLLFIFYFWVNQHHYKLTMNKSTTKKARSLYFSISLSVRLPFSFLFFSMYFLFFEIRLNAWFPCWAGAGMNYSWRGGGPKGPKHNF